MIEDYIRLELITKNQETNIKPVLADMERLII